MLDVGGVLQEQRARWSGRLGRRTRRRSGRACRWTWARAAHCPPAYGQRYVPVIVTAPAATLFFLLSMWAHSQLAHWCMHGDHRIACGIDNILAPVFVEYTISLTNKYVWHTIPVVLAANAGPGPLTLTTRVQDFSKIPKCRAKCFDLVHAGEIKSLVDDLSLIHI